MNRDIKFRLYDKVNKEMRYTETPYTDTVVGGYLGLVFSENFRHDFNQRCIDDFEVMQWTGLTDINGNDIYEGDIVKENQGRTIGVIKFVNGSFVSINGYDRHMIPALFLPHDWEGMVNKNTNFYEVIGNVLEHPELIPEKIKQQQQ